MILVDSSVWVAFFKGKEEAQILQSLLQNQQVIMSDVVLYELLPVLIQKRENDVIDMLQSIPNAGLKTDWQGLVAMQHKNIANGLNKIGLADIIIAQQSLQNQLEIFTLDKHFKLMQQIHQLKLFS